MATGTAATPVGPNEGLGLVVLAAPASVGPGDPVHDVLGNAHLLEHIAACLSPRGRLVFAQASVACRRAVADNPALWATISHAAVTADASACSYAVAAERGNRLCSLLRQFGRHCRRLDLKGCLWLMGTGLEELARCVCVGGGTALRRCRQLTLPG